MEEGGEGQALTREASERMGGQGSEGMGPLPGSTLQ